MSIVEETAPSNRKRHWNVPSTTWFLLMTGTWIAFGVAAIRYPDTLTDFWDWSQGLPLAAEIGLWIGTLPWMLALAVFETSWASWLLISGLAASWILVSAPWPTEDRARRSTGTPAERSWTT